MMQMAHPDRLTRAQAVIAGLFDDKVAVAVTDPQVTQPALIADEGAHLARAFPARRREFAAGRAAARAAMLMLDHAPCAIPAAPDRAPVWPSGLWGSIAHTTTLCVAAVTNAPRHLGIDIEHNSDLSPALLTTVCSDREIDRIAGPDQARLGKLIFCAKEAAYKAQYPETQMLFGFDHIDITLDLATQRFVATFLKPAGRFGVGAQLPGRFDATEDHLVTVVEVPQGAPKGA